MIITLQRNTEWTEDEVNTLKGMLARGRSFSQIGAALGRTRCMISGKVHRLGLTYVGCGMHHTQEEDKKKRDAMVAQLYSEGVGEAKIAFIVGIDRETVHRSLVRTGNKQKRIPGARKEWKALAKRVLSRPMNGYDLHNGKVKLWRSTYYESVVEKPDGPLVAFLDLEPHHCRFPHGDPGEEGFGFCGSDKVDGSPYCAHHSRIAYRRPVSITERERERRSQCGKMQVAIVAWKCGFISATKGEANGL